MKDMAIFGIACALALVLVLCWMAAVVLVIWWVSAQVMVATGSLMMVGVTVVFLVIMIATASIACLARAG